MLGTCQGPVKVGCGQVGSIMRNFCKIAPNPGINVYRSGVSNSLTSRESPTVAEMGKTDWVKSWSSNRTISNRIAGGFWQSKPGQWYTSWIVLHLHHNKADHNHFHCPYISEYSSELVSLVHRGMSMSQVQIPADDNLVLDLPWTPNGWICVLQEDRGNKIQPLP